MGVDITLTSEATGTCITMVTMVRGWLSHMRSGGMGTSALKWTLWWKEEALLVECGPLEAMGIHVNRRAGRPVSSLQPRMDPLWQLHNMSELVVPGGCFEGREQDSWADAVPQRKLRMEKRKWSGTGFRARGSHPESSRSYSRISQKSEVGLLYTWREVKQNKSKLSQKPTRNKRKTVLLHLPVSWAPF